MGTTREDIKILRDLHVNKILDFGSKLSIADLGASQLNYETSAILGTLVGDKFVPAEKQHTSGKDFLKEVLEDFNKSDISIDDYDSGMLSKRFYDDLEFNYTAFDLDVYDNKEYIIPLDLNTDNCPEEHKGRHDIILNHGTTEHLINQTNAFHVMHDLCKVGGVILSTVPCVDINHGFFNYSPVFFETLARDNQYELLFHSIQTVIRNSAVISLYNFNGVRKIKDQDFVQPSQIFNNGNFNLDNSVVATYPRADFALVV